MNSTIQKEIKRLLYIELKSNDKYKELYIEFRKEDFKGNVTDKVMQDFVDKMCIIDINKK